MITKNMHTHTDTQTYSLTHTQTHTLTHSHTHTHTRAATWHGADVAETRCTAHNEEFVCKGINDGAENRLLAGEPASDGTIKLARGSDGLWRRGCERACHDEESRQATHQTLNSPTSPISPTSSNSPTSSTSSNSTQLTQSETAAVTKSPKAVWACSCTSSPIITGVAKILYSDSMFGTVAIFSVRGMASDESVVVARSRSFCSRSCCFARCFSNRCRADARTVFMR